MVIERPRFLYLTKPFKIINWRVIVFAATGTAMGKYLAQRKEIVETAYLEWVNFLPKNEALTLRSRVVSGVKRELEVAKRIKKEALATKAVTKTVRKIVGI